MILNAIRNAERKAKQRNWDTTYWAIDVHDTIVEGNYKTNDIPTTFYPYAKEALQVLSKRQDVKLILYTCSHPYEIKTYLEFFERNEIHFDFVNENTDVLTDINGYGNYDKKPYFNVLLDDKAGFNPITEWEIIYWHYTPQDDQPYIQSFQTKLKVKYQYNTNYGDNKLCKCGHPYYRHFDTYEEMTPVGCKYCRCHNFEPKE